MLNSFGELGLSEEVIEAVEEMGAFVPTEIQCVGIPAVFEGKSVVMSAQPNSGRTLAYLLPLVQVIYFVFPLSFRYFYLRRFNIFSRTSYWFVG